MRLPKAVSAPDWRLWPWIAFLGTLVVYWLTVDPGASYWDCPEYLVTALRLEIGHPPGNPAWALTHRFVSSFVADPAIQVRIVNMMSGLFTALASMLLCSVCISLMRWALTGRDNAGVGSLSKRGKSMRRYAVGFSSLCGSLCFGWSDSAWYSAVEAEVYAMSIFLTALTVWMTLKWAFAGSRACRARWLIAMAYIMGLSIGVHQLNLLVIPAVALVMAFRKYTRRKLGIWRGLGVMAAGCGVVGIILLGLMPWSLRIAAKADIMAVNSLGLPYWSGACAFWALSLTIAVTLAVIMARRSPAWGMAIWCLAAIMLGYSVYIIIPIRAWANPPVNTGNPASPMQLADYLDRRQYGGAPLFHGRTPFSQVMRLEKTTVNASGDTVWDYSANALEMSGKDYRPVGKGARIPMRSRFLTDADRALNTRLMADTAPHGYAVTGFRLKEIYTPELDMWFPRLYSGAPDDFKAYGDWTGMDSANMVKTRVSEAFDSVGNPVPRRDAEGNPVVKESLRPTYLQNLTFLLGYQTGYMYLRYLMWNFMGRQNDISSTGEIEHGNFITGFAPVDNRMLGDQSALPPELGKDNPGHTVLVFPFVFGIFGILALAWSSRLGLSLKRHRVLEATAVLFLMTGIAIVFYLNQNTGEPRERDYSFLGSFWSFCIWIAFGIAWCFLRMREGGWIRVRLAIVSVLFFALLPGNMLLQNYHGHDRSGRSATLDYASNLLESLPEDAILFVDGDNYIFPLWFAQEVMGVRRDVNVVCNAYFGSDWYIARLMIPGDGNDGIRFTASEGDIAYGNCNLIRFPSENGDTLDAITALRTLYADTAAMPRFPARFVRMGGGTQDPWIFDMLSMPGKRGGSTASLREVAMVDLLATNAASRYPRPIYWHDRLGNDKCLGLLPFTRQGLYARRLMPNAPDTLVLLEEAVDALPKLKWGGADGFMNYAGPDVALQISGQRSALVRLAETLLNGGRPDLALKVAKEAYVRFPSKIAPYLYSRRNDSTYYEASGLARVLEEAGRMEKDSVAVALGKKILEEDSIRDESYRRYYESLPLWRRKALTPSFRYRVRQATRRSGGNGT